MDTSGQEIQNLTFEAVRDLVTSSETCQDWSYEQKDGFLQQLQSEVKRRQHMSSPLIEKSIRQLIDDGLPFLVEKYQRGYKWTAIQVDNLLNDIDAFAPETHDSFYCLQPLVVSYQENPSCWELIDGQQRLTTIYLVLSYLGIPSFPLIYKTRPGCTNFLASLPKRGIIGDSSWSTFVQTHGREVDNVDNFHFFQAWLTIARWFDRHQDIRQSWLDKLLHKTKVIWYNTMASDKKETTQIFIRINSGKIALTNAELVKALFLRKDSTVDSEISREEIAWKWDYIEQELQNDAFWYFLTGSRGIEMPNRIELLFDIRARRPAAKSEDPFYTFNHFANQANFEQEWREINKLFLRLKDWFEDDETYHLIGFLVATKVKSVGELAKDEEIYTKRKFTDLLKRYLQEHFAKVDLEGLRYSVDNRTIQQVLLLFNVQKCMVYSQSNRRSANDGLVRESANRFPFDRYIKENWSLEHIHAQHSQKLDDKDAVTVFYCALKPILINAEQESYADPAAKQQLKHLTDQLEALNAEPNKGSAEAKKLIAELRSGSFSYFGEGIDEAEVDSIDNLALLNRDDNSKLNNAIFPEKRKMIRAFDQIGRFIPAGTKDVFMKYYTDNVTQMSRWSKDDRAAYLKNLKEALIPAYLPEIRP